MGDIPAAAPVRGVRCDRVPAARVVFDVAGDSVGQGIVTLVRHVVENRIDYDLNAVLVSLCAHRLEIGRCAQRVRAVGVDMEL